MKKSKPIDYIFWGVISFGSPILMLFGLSNYPLVDQKTYGFVFVGIYSISLTWTIWLRRKLFPWAHQKGDFRFYEFCGLLSVPVILTMLFSGLFFIINGLLANLP